MTSQHETQQQRKCKRNVMKEADPCTMSSHREPWPDAAQRRKAYGSGVPSARRRHNGAWSYVRVVARNNIGLAVQRQETCRICAGQAAPLRRKPVP